MKYFAVLAFASIAAAARLDNTVLLPPHADSSGGGNAGLETPYDYQNAQGYDPATYQAGGTPSAQAYSPAAYQAGESPSAQAYDPAAYQAGNPSAQAQILSYENEINEDGYHYAFETSDRTKVEQTGRVYPGAKPEEGSLSVSGSYSYIGDDGQEYTVTYTADENGYRAEGAHLPTPPPIPIEILKSLQLTDPSRGQYDSNKSSYDADAGL